MALEEYRKKRHFDRTPEPAGDRAGAGETAGGLYVIQKHAARRLHYDFRLELDGVLKSWAVPKGPSLDPSQKRLAVHVEDHPIEYGGFEGSIPEGEYGGGTVELWDRGTWTALEDPRAGYEKGTLKVVLDGEKLKGLFTLVRMHAKVRPPDKNWLLFKDKDEWAKPLSDGDVLAERPESVATGRTLDEIADDPGSAVYSSAEGKLVKAGKARKGVSSGRPAAPVDPSKVAGARKGPMPREVDLQLATLVKEAPSGEEWIHEIKFDGYRLTTRIDFGEVKLLTRSGADWTERFPEIAEAVAALPVERVILDGEVVSFRPDGSTSFSDLGSALSAARTQDLVYQVFDILYLDGYRLTGSTLLERKRLLARLLPAGQGWIRYTDHVDGRGEAFHRQACRFALEGVVSKRSDRPHHKGRSRDWLKVKCLLRQEFVVAGFTEPRGARKGLGALVLGYHDPDGGLVAAGRVGTGFTDRQLSGLSKRLAKLERKTSPFASTPKGTAAHGVHWVRPKVVVEVEFVEWTPDGSLRHPSFKGVRDDKDPAEVVREDLPSGQAAAVEPGEAVGLGSARDAGRGGSDTTVAGIKLTHPDKVLYPQQGITKLQLARYYEAIAAWILPHVVDRPLTLVRCPEGQTGECFYQKHVQEAFPDAVLRMTLQDKDGPAEYAYVESIEGVVSLAQMGVLEIHTWGSRVADVDSPDRLTFDLDPGPGVGPVGVAKAALVLRDALQGVGLVPFVKTTGGKGLHVVTPVETESDWQTANAVAKAMAQAMERAAPDRYTANPLKSKRKKRVFIDYMRNARGATAVAAFSTRAQAGAPVSVPVRWADLKKGLDLATFTIETVPKRFGSRNKDPWAKYGSSARSVLKAGRALGVET